MTCRAPGGNAGEFNIRLIVHADRPEPLWELFSRAHAVLRLRPSAAACLSRETRPASNNASRSSPILAHCLAFMAKMLAVTTALIVAGPPTFRAACEMIALALLIGPLMAPRGHN